MIIHLSIILGLDCLTSVIWLFTFTAFSFGSYFTNVSHFKDGRVVNMNFYLHTWSWSVLPSSAAVTKAECSSLADFRLTSTMFCHYIRRTWNWILKQDYKLTGKIIKQNKLGSCLCNFVFSVRGQETIIMSCHMWFKKFQDAVWLPKYFWYCPLLWCWNCHCINVQYTLSGGSLLPILLILSL